MGWCKFYQKEVDMDDSPKENDCRNPDAMTIDIISCQDCECFDFEAPEDED